MGRIYKCTGSNIRQITRRLGIDISPRRVINPKETFRRGTAKKGKCKNCGKEFILYLSHYVFITLSNFNEFFLTTTFVRMRF